MHAPSQAPQSSPSIGASLRVTGVSARTAALAQLPPGEWSPADLVHFICEETVRLHGEQLPCLQAEQIITGFWQRYGADGVLIARRAFEVHGGMWHSAPVTVRRFEAGQDEYFARPLLAEIQG